VYVCISVARTLRRGQRGGTSEPQVNTPTSLCVYIGLSLCLCVYLQHIYCAVVKEGAQVNLRYIHLVFSVRSIYAFVCISVARTLRRGQRGGTSEPRVYTPRFLCVYVGLYMCMYVYL